MNNHFLLASLVFVGVYGALIWDKFNRAVIALLGASVLVLLGVLNQEQAIHGVDFNTIGLLIGMMVIVAVCQRTGMFQYLAIKSAKVAKGDPWRLMVMLAVVTAFVSAFLDNVTTVLLMAPLTILFAEEMKIDFYPFLFVEIFASNIGGTATLIGDPPNIMIGSAAGLSFMDFVRNLTPPIIVIMAATLVPFYFIYGRKLKVADDVKQRIMAFNELDAIKDWALVRKCLAVLALVIGGFLFQRQLHLEPATIASLGAGVLLFLTGDDVHEISTKVEWTTIFFFTGLFIVVKGIEEVGLISMLAKGLMDITAGNKTVMVLSILWVSAIASAFIDNIPFVATMLPLIKEVGVQMGGSDAVLPLWWALSLGACLGGNGTMIGASANVIVAGISDRAGRPFNFIEYMKMAFPLMLISIIISTIYLYLVYL
ncbi:MAG: ArsB/NhaD family transporter [Deltaproteobacteria bacterium]|nr:ArsB/NhaD family transporter [Deltaproteobacteria bacterium]